MHCAVDEALHSPSSAAITATTTTIDYLCALLYLSSSWTPSLRYINFNSPHPSLSTSSAMAMASPPPLFRAATKRVPAEPAYMTTASASQQLLPPSILPPPPTSLAHSTLTTLGPYQTQTVPLPQHPSPAPTYLPHPLSPPSPPSSSLLPPPSLLDSLLLANKARESADARLRLDVAAKARAFAEAVAQRQTHSTRTIEARTHERARQQLRRWEEKEALCPPPSSLLSSSSPPSSLGYSQAQAGGERVAWEVKAAPVAAEAKKSKREKEREEADRRQRDLSLAHSPLSSVPAPSLPALLAPPSAPFLGSALPVSFSAFRPAQPLPTSDVARGLLGPGPLPAGSPVEGVEGAGGVDRLRALYAGAELVPVVPMGGGGGGGEGGRGLGIQRRVTPEEAVAAALAGVEEETRRCKQRLAEAGVWVHEGALERGLGAGVGGIAGLGAGGLKEVWMGSGAGLVEDPKKKSSGEKKAAAKGGKAAKKK